MRDADKTVPMGWHQKKAHEEVDHIFQELMPKHGLTVREEQLRLILSRLVDTFSSRILYPMLLSVNHSIAVV